MTKMTNKQVFRGTFAALAGVLLCTVSFSAASAQQSKMRIVQTNSAGDNVHIIDVAPDNSRIYISEESTDTVVVIDAKNLQEIKRIMLSGNPNLIDLTPDGKTLYVAIALTYNDLSDFPQIKAAASGGVDVIDTNSLTNVKTIALKGGIHDLNVTPDAKKVIAG